MKQPYVSTLISQNFTSAEKALARDNIEAISSAALDGYVKSEDLEEYVTSGDLSSYATTEYVDQSVSEFITSADLPDMTDVATKSWVSDQNYLTSVPSQYVTEDELTSAVSGKADRSEIPDVSDFTTHSEVDAAIQSATSGKMDQSESANFYPRYSNPEGYLTSIPYQYVTDTEMRNYVTDQTSAFITSADIPPIPEDVVTSAELASVSGEIVSQIPSLAGYATEQYVTDHTSAFVTQTDIDQATSGKMDKSQSADFYPMATNPSGYLTEHQSLAGYATEQYVQDYTEAFITSSDLPDVSDMATMTWVNNQNYITSADVPAQVEYSAGSNIDITNHVISVDGTSQIIPGDNVSITPSGDDYVISAQVPETSAFVTEQEMNESIQSATSAFLTSADIESQKQADWTEADSGAVDYIKNKPQNLVQDASYVHTDNNFTNLDKIKLDGIEQGATKVQITEVPGQAQPLTIHGGELRFHWGDGLVCYTPPSGASVLELNPNLLNKIDGIETGAQVNVQSDWTQSASTADDYIKNKPTIIGIEQGRGISISTSSASMVISTSDEYVNSGFVLSSIQSATSGLITSADVPAQVQSDWTQADSASVDYIKNKPFTGSLEAESPLYFTDDTSGSTIHIESSAIVPSGQGSDQYLALVYGSPTWKECTKNVYYANIPQQTTITSADIANGYMDIQINMGFGGSTQAANNFIWSMDIYDGALWHNSQTTSLVGIVEKIKTSTYNSSFTWYDYTQGALADPYGVLFDNILESDLAGVTTHSYLAKPIHMVGGSGKDIYTLGASMRIMFKTPLNVVEGDKIYLMGRIYAVRCDAQW